MGGAWPRETTTLVVQTALPSAVRPGLLSGIATGYKVVADVVSIMMAPAGQVPWRAGWISLLGTTDNQPVTDGRPVTTDNH